MKKIPIAKPILDEEVIGAIKEVIISGQLAQGSVVDKFEDSFSKYVNVKNSIAVCNGTVALDVALKAIDIKDGDEVITTPFTFIATANSILYQRARPVFADIDEKTFNIDPEDIQNKITDKTKAIIGVHLFGHPFDVKAVKEICDDHKLILIEDCAQAHGAEYDNKKVGTFGIGCFSFYPTKNITTGEGGIITTNDNDIAELCKLLRNHGQSQKYFHTILGYNYRMTNINASMGVIQIKKLDYFNSKRIYNANYLNDHIKLEGIVTPFIGKKVKHVYHQYVITLGENINRENLIKYLNSNGIESAIHYPMPIYDQPLYRKLYYRTVSCPITEKLSRRVLSLPVHPSLMEDDLKYITDTINNFEV